MIKQLTNNEIYTYANLLLEHFSDKDLKLPIRINFYLQKNIKEFTKLAQEIEQERMNIAQEHGILNEETSQYEIPKEYIEETSNKLNELLNLTQDVNIYLVNLKDFGDIELTTAQMQALMFMINEEE